jgi:hypothetical protein
MKKSSILLWVLVGIAIGVLGTISIGCTNRENKAVEKSNAVKTTKPESSSELGILYAGENELRSGERVYENKEAGFKISGPYSEIYFDVARYNANGCITFAIMGDGFITISNNKLSSDNDMPCGRTGVGGSEKSFRETIIVQGKNIEAQGIKYSNEYSLGQDANFSLENLSITYGVRFDRAGADVPDSQYKDSYDGKLGMVKKMLNNLEIIK